MSIVVVVHVSNATRISYFIVQIIVDSGDQYRIVQVSSSIISSNSSSGSIYNIVRAGNIAVEKKSRICDDDDTDQNKSSVIDKSCYNIILMKKLEV